MDKSTKLVTLMLKLLVALGILTIVGMMINRFLGYWGVLGYILVILMINFEQLRKMTK